MNCLFQAYSVAILSRTSRFVARSSFCGFSTASWKRNFDNASIRTTNLEFVLTRFRVQCYSTRRGSSGSKSHSRKLDPKPVMEEEKDAFFVVRKGDVVGVYKSLSDCQAQVGSSICDPPVSVYKGYSMPKDTEEYLVSCGLKNALYSIRAADLKEDIFGPLVPCPFQQPSSSKGETSIKDLPKKRSQEVLGSDVGEAVGSTSISKDLLRKHVKLDHDVEAQALSSGRFCILEFDGASKGNPGQAGAGAVLRAGDGSLICRLREGLGKATNNVAEYRAMILGLRYALKKGFTSIRVLGDSKLVCMQIQGLWKVKHQNMSELYEEAKKLKDKFISFQISHVLRDLNAEADAQANLAVNLADGQVQEEMGVVAHMNVGR
uniref:RNase H type-1 domain-containing protein n=1 Tax=Davidia involucrata TaxID=16924 RepID=A0A5B7B4I0_DAVIN